MKTGQDDLDTLYGYFFVYLHTYYLFVLYNIHMTKMLLDRFIIWYIYFFTLHWYISAYQGTYIR